MIIHCFLVISTYGYYNPSKNYLNPLRKRILLMSATLKCWLALVLTRLNADSHSIANSVIRGKSIMMTKMALRTMATFSMHQNIQILSPATLQGSWEMRQFMVPLRSYGSLVSLKCLNHIALILILEDCVLIFEEIFLLLPFSFC